MRRIPALLIFLFLAACSEPTQDNIATKSAVTAKMDNWGKEVDDSVFTNPHQPLAGEVPASDKIDFTKPENVVYMMIAYAKKGNYDEMKTLCSKSAMAQNDAHSICNGNKELFEKLAKAETTAADMKINKKTAEIPIMINGSTIQKSIVKLSFEDGNWYIAKIEDLKNNQ